VETQKIEAVTLHEVNTLAQCDCGAVVWCYIDGYRVKPPVVRRAKDKPQESSNMDSLEKHSDSTLQGSKRHAPRTRRTCVCGRTFLAKRKDARLCSDACRSRASRQSTGSLT
jgi:hypothetical protein